MASTPIRQTSRVKKPSQIALEALRSLKIQNSGIIQSAPSDDEDDTSEDILKENAQVLQKPVTIHENELVHGENIFTFQTRKTKNSIAQKVAEACIMKTPYNFRKKTKNGITKLLKEDSDCEFDYSSEDSICDNLSEESSEDEMTTNKLAFKESHWQLEQSQNRKYNIKTDEYFEKSASKKNLTSNNTLEKLDTPKLPPYLLQKLLYKSTLTNIHKDALLNLNKVHENCFKKWLYFLNENFNILLYGLGSKKCILNKFQKTYLKNLPVVVVNGYFPSLSVKNILDIILDLLEINENTGNFLEACNLIVQEMEKSPENHLYLIIHNIESEILSNGKSQSIIGKVASIKNIHLIATIDHINSPLIWDHKKLSKFNYIWWDATSFAQYLEETSFEQSMMIQQGSTLALSSLKNVFASLTSNSKNIYILIVKYQLNNATNQYYQGLAFKNLYMSCRESFIVSSDLALRAQLTEFVDHKMLKIKRSVDGTEYLLIPLANSLLQKFLDDQ